VIILQVIVALFLIMVVLLQPGNRGERVLHSVALVATLYSAVAVPIPFCPKSPLALLFVLW